MPRLGLGLGIDKQGIKQNPIIPSSLQSNALALYTTRPSGLSDFAVDMENKIVNGDFANGTTGWTGQNATLTATNNTLTSTGTVFAYVTAIRTTTIPASNGKKLAIVLKRKVTNSNCVAMYVAIAGSVSGEMAFGVISNPTINTIYSAPFVATLDASIVGNVIIKLNHQYVDNATANGKVMEVQEVMCIDLSVPLPLNEPTATEFFDMLTYKGSTFWNGTEKVVINPNDKYYWPDRSGNGRHLHLVNVAYDATGGLQVGPPANYLFDGVNDYAVFNSATDIVVANGAVSAFVVFQAKDTVNATNQRLLQFATGSNVLFGNISVSQTNSFFAIADSISGTSQAGNTGIPLPNIWYSIASSYNAPIKSPECSFNGNTIVVGVPITNGTYAIRKLYVSSSYLLAAFANNRFGEMYLFNKNLTQSEITSLIKNLKTRYGNIG